MATAELRQNSDRYPPTLTRTPQGYTGSRTYVVDGAATIEAVFAATDLPAQGDAWGAAPFDKLYARTFTPVLEQGMWAAVRVDYAENTGGGAITPTPGYVLTTSIDAQETSETVKLDITGTIPLGEDGVTKLLTAISIEVVQYFATAAEMVAVLPAVFGLCNEPKLNENPIACPNLFDSGIDLVIPARQALYGAPRFFREGDLYAVAHRIKWREKWDAKLEVYGPDFAPDGPLGEEAVYEEADFVSVFDPA